jgi:hypothetical protein
VPLRWNPATISWSLKGSPPRDKTPVQPREEETPLEGVYLGLCCSVPA